MSLKRYDCSVLGDVLWDVIIHTEARGYVPGGTDYCDFCGIFPGGAGNVAAALAHLGREACLIGKAGNDWLGKLYVEVLGSHGATPLIQFHDSLATGVATVSIGEGGERSFTVFRGANDALLPAEVEEAGAIPRSTFLLISGFSLVGGPQREAVLHAANLARTHGVQIVFDPGAHNLIAGDREVFGRLMDQSDVLCANLDEARALSGETAVMDMVARIRTRVPFVALKMGNDGCILSRGDDIATLRGHEVPCVDTTGAGDAFVAALIHGLVSGLRLEQLGKLANWFAAQAVTGYGARHFPSQASTRQFLAEEIDPAG